MSSPDDDPIRRRRARVAHWTLLANRMGYLLLALAVVLFFVAFATGFTATMATLVIATLIVACVLLAPSIVLGYAVKAADARPAGHPKRRMMLDCTHQFLLFPLWVGDSLNYMLA